MNKKRFLKSLTPLLYCALFFTSFTSCKKDPAPEPEPEPVNYWKDKTIVWAGGSTAWLNESKSYPDKIAGLLGAKILNTAIPNATITFIPRSATYPNGSAGMAATYTQLTQANFQHPYSYMSTVFADTTASLVVIDIGKDDSPWIKEKMGDVSSTDIGTFYGALNTVVNAAKAKMPNATIVLCTPLIEFVYGGKNVDQVGRQRDIATAIRAVAQAQNVGLWDLMGRSGLTVQNQNSWTNSNNTLPNQAKIDSIAKDGYQVFMNDILPKDITK